MIPESAIYLAQQRLARSPSPETLDQYNRLLAAMARNGQGLAEAPSRTAFDRARAAVTYAAAQHILEMHEAVSHRDDGLTAEEHRDVIACGKVLLLFPPEGVPVPAEDLADLQRRDFPATRGASKRQVLYRLGRKDGFDAERIFDRIAANGVCVLAGAITLAAGPRPDEVARGIDIESAGPADDPVLMITVYGSKHDGVHRGYAWRKICFESPGTHATTRALVRAAAANGGALRVATSPDRLRRALKRAAGDVLGSAGYQVTPYVWRHAVAVRVRQDQGLSAAARVLGHANVKSTRWYRGSGGGGPCPTTTLLSGREPRSDLKQAPPTPSQKPASEPPANALSPNTTLTTAPIAR